MKVLGVLGLSIWLVGMASMFALAGVETQALWQPTTASGQYHHPHLIKGRIRYLTDLQEHVHSVVVPLSFAAWITGVVIAVAYNRSQARRQEERKKALLDRIDLGF